MPTHFYVKSICNDTLGKERIRVLSRLKEVVPEGCLFEIGSTAIEGVIGKQDLDFLVRVAETDFNSTRTVLDGVFTRNPDQLSNDLYQGYTVDSALDVAIQLTVQNGPFDNFLSFLEALRASADLRQEYNELKMEFDGRLMSEYRDAKHEFIERVLLSSKKS